MTKAKSSSKFIVLFLVCFCCNAFSQTNFERIYGSWDNDNLTDMQLTADGGSIMTGSTEGFSHTPASIFLVKTAASGLVEWSKLIGDTTFCVSTSIALTNDAGYAITGMRFDSVANTRDVVVVKTDSAGNTTWSKSYALLGDELANGVHQTMDGSFIINGSTRTSVSSSYFPFLIKLDASGNVVWNKIFDSFAGTSKNYCTLIFNGHYVFLGERYNTTLMNGDIFLTEIDTSGNVVWYKTYDAGNDYAEALSHTADDGFIILGRINTLSPFLLKTDAAGNIQWSKEYIASCITSSGSVEQTHDLGYIVCGLSVCVGFKPVVLLKTNASGSVVWQKNYEFLPGGSQQPKSVHQVFADGSYVIGVDVGDFGLIRTGSNGSADCADTTITGDTSAVLFFTAHPDSLNFVSQIVSNTLAYSSFVVVLENDTNLCSTTGIAALPPEETVFQISPNPCSGQFIVNFNRVIHSGTLVISDVYGKLVFSGLVKDEQQMKIELGQSLAGMYFAGFYGEGISSYRKIILE